MKNRLLQILSPLICMAMVIASMCTSIKTSDIDVPVAVTDYLQEGDYFSIYPVMFPDQGYPTHALSTQRIMNEVQAGYPVIFYSIPIGK